MKVNKLFENLTGSDMEDRILKCPLILCNSGTIFMWRFIKDLPLNITNQQLTQLVEISFSPDIVDRFVYRMGAASPALTVSASAESRQSRFLSIYHGNVNEWSRVVTWKQFVNNIEEDFEDSDFKD